MTRLLCCVTELPIKIRLVTFCHTKQHILCSVGENLNLIQGISILTWDPSNTSTHVPVTCCLPDISKQSQTDDSNQVRKKIRWEKLDRDRYRKSVESGVQGISLETVSLSDLNAKLQVFCDVLVDAAEKSAPCIRRGKKKRLWSDELKQPLLWANRCSSNGRRLAGLVHNTLYLYIVG